MNGRVLCGDREAQCRCYKEAGHVEAGDRVHECDTRRCTGSWTRDDNGVLQILSLPFPVDQPRPWDTP